MSNFKWIPKSKSDFIRRIPESFAYVQFESFSDLSRQLRQQHGFLLCLSLSLSALCVAGTGALLTLHSLKERGWSGPKSNCSKKAWYSSLIIFSILYYWSIRTMSSFKYTSMFKFSFSTVPFYMYCTYIFVDQWIYHLWKEYSMKASLFMENMWEFSLCFYFVPYQVNIPMYAGGFKQVQ